jgi:hypothetical protein
MGLRITEEADEEFENELLEFLNGNNHGKVWERRSLWSIEKCSQCHLIYPILTKRNFSITLQVKVLFQSTLSG